jgi:hypothetical protein
VRGRWRPVQDPAAGAFGFVGVVAFVGAVALVGADAFDGVVPVDGVGGFLVEAVALARSAGVLAAVDRSGSC